MATHPAVVTVAPRAPLELHHLPTIPATGRLVRIRNEWTASTPLDLHQADGGLLVSHPQALGDGVAGTVVEVGPEVKSLNVGDKVFGFTWRNQAEKAHQLYVTAPENLLGKVPDGFSMQQAVLLGNNFVTAWHTLTHDFNFALPWPKPENYVPPEANDFILIWGASSSVGQYAIQILRWYGYNKIIATASKAHHDKLKRYGATACFDYREPNTPARISDYIGEASIVFIIDCIGSLNGSVQPVSRIARAGAKIAIMLPVIIRDTSEGVEPEYEMDVTKCAAWAEGVQAIGVRTHFYMENKFLAEHLQSEIMPEALKRGIVEPNDQVVVEGSTLLERAEKALGILRGRGVSGGRLVWRVAEEGEGEV